MLVNVLTLVGMIGVMFYLNWRFTLIALSVSPVLFLVVYSFTRRIKKASREVRKKEGELLSIVDGSPDLDSRRQGVRARRLRAGAIRSREPGQRGDRARRRAASKRSWRPSWK